MRGFLRGTVFARRTAAYAVVAVAASIVAMGLFGAAQPAAAQQGFGNFFGYQTQQPKRRVVRRKRRPAADEATVEKKTAEKPKDAKEKSGPIGPVYAVISLGDQHISVYDSTGRIAQSRVSTGTAGHRTPMGVFSVIQRNRWHRSNIYSGAPMPWMQRITWSGVAMHAGVVPGYPASHGCIRLPYSFAPQMWNLTSMGSRVLVVRNDTVPYEIAHSFLPQPVMQPAPAAAASQQAAQEPASPIELASMGMPAHVGVTTSAVAEGTVSAASRSARLNPIAYAAALKERVKADKAAADQAAKEALKAAQAAGAEARLAVEDMSKAQADIAAAEAQLAELDARAAAPPAEQPADASAADKAKADLETARTAARSELVRARAALDSARAREAIKTPAAFGAVQVWKDAVALSEAAADTLSEAERRSEPVSVLISKKEGRIFIRQDWKEVYEAPITVRDPDRPLGTHVFIAVGAEPDGSAMRWSAISVPPEAVKSDDRQQPKRAKDTPELPVAKNGPSAPAGPETAAGALDRIELPAEARQRMAELLWTGASLIVSDNPRSYEMGEYTDFIVLTR